MLRRREALCLVPILVRDHLEADLLDGADLGLGHDDVAHVRLTGHVHHKVAMGEGAAQDVVVALGGEAVVLVGMTYSFFRTFENRIAA